MSFDFRSILCLNIIRMEEKLIVRNLFYYTYTYIHTYFFGDEELISNSIRLRMYII